MENQSAYVQETTVEANPLLTQAAVESWRSSVPWIKFISIVGFIMCGFMLLAAIGMLAAGSYAGGLAGAGMGIFLMFFYLIYAVIYFIPNLYLYHYANKIMAFYRTADSLTLEQAFGIHKRFWSYIGVLLIITIALFIIFILVFTLTHLSMNEPFLDTY